MLTVRYNPAASKELIASSLYYEKQAPGLGERFLKDVESSVREIANAPQRYTRYQGEVRRYIMSQFPYGIYYREVGTKIRIVSIAHSSRYPAYWRHRK